MTLKDNTSNSSISRSLPPAPTGYPTASMRQEGNSYKNREDKILGSLNSFWKSVIPSTDIDFKSMPLDRLINLKKSLSDINNLITLRVTYAFIDSLEEIGAINNKTAEAIRTQVSKESPNANGFDIDYFDVQLNTRIIAEIKCNIPVNKSSFGAMQEKGIINDIDGLVNGKSKAPSFDLSMNHQKFMVFLDYGNNTRIAVDNIVDKII